MTDNFNLSCNSRVIFGRPSDLALGTMCRVSVACLSVTHVLWLNRMLYGVCDGAVGYVDNAFL